MQPDDHKSVTAETPAHQGCEAAADVVGDDDGEGRGAVTWEEAGDDHQAQDKDVDGVDEPAGREAHPAPLLAVRLQRGTRGGRSNRLHQSVLRGVLEQRLGGTREDAVRLRLAREDSFCDLGEASLGCFGRGAPRIE